MLFDVQAALSEILGDTPAIPAISAIPPSTNSRNSRNSSQGSSNVDKAKVVGFAPTSRTNSESRSEKDLFRHGRSVSGSPLTWTGRIVSLADWRQLSEWERDGSTGKLWNGITRRWKPAENDGKESNT